MEGIIFSPANTTDLREVVYEKIKDAIVTGLIPAGSKLSELDLSKQFDVSRTPVREAIRQLAEAGLVSLAARRGAYVLLPTAKDAWDLYEIRTALELISVEHLCQNPPSEFLLNARAKFREASEDWNDDMFMKMDEEFHSMMAKHADNNFLDFLLDKVSAILQICRHYAIVSLPKVNSSMEHIAIIDAILDGNAALAKENMTLHLSRTRDALIEYTSKHPESTSPE
ncbi:MAG: GntR family transcriptional regulator [Synergistaceae bacterium]|jgi:DNA-binding GntR family transcriptional regulator|nr:GntR family transcriptional regulator [Synergistaceae bacterium]